MGEKHRIGVHESVDSQSHTVHWAEATDLKELRQALSEYGLKLFWTEQSTFVGESRTPMCDPKRPEDFTQEDFEWLIDEFPLIDRYVAFRP